MFRIAAGEELGYDDPEVARPLDRVPDQRRGRRPQLHARARHPDRAGTPPSGPGVRLDGGYEDGETVPGAFDSLIAKLIVTGRDRTQALERSRRALAEFVVDGMPTVIPFHRAVVDDPAYIGSGSTARGTFGVYTQWIETEFDNQIAPYAGDAAEADEPDERQHGHRRGRRHAARGRAARRARRRSAAAGARRAKKPKRAAGKKAGAAASGDAVTSPDAGHHRQGRRRGGPEVAEGDVIVVLEAMKMEQPLKAHKAGTVTGLQAEVGATVTNGAVICEIKDA